MERLGWSSQSISAGRRMAVTCRELCSSIDGPTVYWASQSLKILSCCGTVRPPIQCGVLIKGSHVGPGPPGAW